MDASTENMYSQGEVMRKVEASQGKWSKMHAQQFAAQRESEKNSRLPRQKGHHSREETKAAQATKKILEIVRRELKDNRFLTHIRNPPKIRIAQANMRQMIDIKAVTQSLCHRFLIKYLEDCGYVLKINYI